MLVEFADLQSTVTADVDAMLNGPNYTANGNFCSVRDYFLTVSNGKLDYSNTVVGPVRLLEEPGFLQGDVLRKGGARPRCGPAEQRLLGVRLENERIIDAINFMYAGRTLYEGELWPHNADLRLQYGNYHPTPTCSRAWAAARSTFRSALSVARAAHLLCRFPDMYDYGERDGDFEGSHGIGVYCLMGSSNHSTAAARRLRSAVTCATSSAGQATRSR